VPKTHSERAGYSVASSWSSRIQAGFGQWVRHLPFHGVS
jgi:hypothetical protein